LYGYLKQIIHVMNCVMCGVEQSQLTVCLTVNLTVNVV